VLTANLARSVRDKDQVIVRAALPQARVEVVEATSVDAALTAIRSTPHHILHVASIGERARNAQALLVGNAKEVGRLTGKDIAAALPGPPRIAMLACSESDLVAAELAQHIPAVIGMRGTISPDGCDAFLRGLYTALASGSSVGRAVGAGRAQQLSFSNSFGDEWSLPVAFLSRNTDQLVEAGELTAAARLDETGPVQLAPVNVQLLQMKTANLQAMRAQWDPYKVNAVPPFIRTHIAALERDIAALEREVDELKRRTGAA
jgi:hypothetical protein